MKRSDRDWALVRAHYETSRDTLRQVAVRFGIAERTVFRRSAKEGWCQSGSAMGAADGSGEGGNGSDPLPNLSDDGSRSSQNGSNLPRNGSGDGSHSPGNGSANGSKQTEHGSAAGPKKPMEAERFVIPDGINELSRLEAARFYVEKLGWAIHPLYGPKQGRANERGKKPLSEEWKRHRCRDATPEFLLRHFGGRRSHNLGCVIGGDFVHVDLDSKKDEGASVHLPDRLREPSGGMDRKDAALRAD